MEVQKVKTEIEESKGRSAENRTGIGELRESLQQHRENRDAHIDLAWRQDLTRRLERIEDLLRQK